MLNSGRRGKRAPDGYGIQSVNEKFNQANYPIPIIDSWSITDGSYNPIDDTALDTAGGQTVVVYGSGFTSGVTVNINGTNISPVTLLDSGRLTFTSPTLASASYTIYVSNTDGATAIYVPGLVYSGLPTWSSPSAGSIGTGYETKSTSLLSSNTFIATGDAPITYSITSGNLPSGVTLSSGGVLSGSLPATASSTTYSFTITASDAQNQDSSRSFSLTINPDVVTWVAPTQNGSLTVYETKAFSTPLSATSAAGYGVMYAANTLPTGITLSTDSGALNGYANTVGTTNAMLTATANTTGRYSTSNVLFTVTQDSVTWSSPANNTTYSLGQDVTMSSVPLTATSAAGYGVQYTANSLPTGVTLSGGTISGTPTVSGTSTTQLTATANTTNRVSYVYINWSVSIASDTYFANTVMLLSANSQLQTSSFITDNSNNNLQLTIAGDTKPNLFNPYSQGYYSNYFDGTTDSISFSSNVITATGNFTMEGWYYVMSSAAMLGGYPAGGGFELYYGGTYVSINIYGGASYNATVALPKNQWVHLAVVRNGGTWYLYQNGVCVLTQAWNPTFTLGTFNIGDAGAGTYLQGYVSNFRITNTIVYPNGTTFTPPTQPLTAISGTQVLTCQSPRFIDNSPNNYVITKNGDTTVSSAHPFVTSTTSSYNTQYSTYFDGTGDYLSVPSNAAFAFGTGDYTLEFWVYPTVALSSTRCFYNTNDAGYFLQWAAGSGLQTGIPGSSTTGTYSVTINTSQWTHVAISRASGSSRCFINGTQSGTTLTDNTNYTQNGAYIGALYDGSQAFTGYISNFRVVKGQALYTTTFTPSTTPLTTTSQSATASNVSLLTCQNSTLIDNSLNNFTFTSYNQAQPIAVSPFTMTTSNTTVTSLGSVYLDGTGDYLNLGNNSNLNPGTGDFTLDFWVYLINDPTLQTSLFEGYTSGLSVSFNAAGYLQVSHSNVTALAADNVVFARNVWTHVAVSRVGTSLKLFKNGVMVGSATSSTNFVTGTANYLGYNSNTLYIQGYFSDLRFIKGTGLYTANFLPPQAPLTPVANTQLLTVQTNGGATNNGFVDQSSFNNIITRNGNTTQGTFSPYSQTGWSNYFDGTGDYLSWSGTTLTSDFTVECWVYKTAVDASGYTNVFGGSNNQQFSIDNATAGSISLVLNGTLIISPSGTAVTLNEWHHLAWVRQGTTCRAYVDGVQRGTGTAAGSFTLTLIGQYQLGGYDMNGYISNARIVNGTCLYPSGTTFTPSTTPLTAVENTALLTCQSNRLIDNSPYNFTITKNGDTSIQAYSPFGGVTSVPTSYSTYFNGSTDYVSVPNITGLQFTGAFTIEAWVYYSTAPTTQQVWLSRGSSGTGTWSIGTVGSGSSVTRFYYDGSGTGITFNTSLSINTWYHIALVRDGSNVVSCFINGVKESTTSTVATSFSNAVTTNIGTSRGIGAPWFNGYLSNLRLTKEALYTTNFTPSTTPLTTTSQGATASNVGLLTCQNNTIVDNSVNYNTMTAGTTTVKPLPFNPFGMTNTSSVAYTPAGNGGSMYFDGSGDYLTVGTFAPGTNNFTVDFWFYCTALPATGQQGMFLATPYTDPNNFQVFIRDDSAIMWQSYAQNNTPVTVKLNQWYHVAVVKNGSTAYFYINGVLQNTAVLSNSISGTAYVGARGTDALYFTGYISDMRTSIGSVLYTSNFYPGAAPATPKTTIGAITHASNLLLKGTSGGMIDQSGKTTLETVGDTKLVPETPYAGSYYSNYFDGTGDYLQTPDAGSYAGDITAECWVYPTQTTARMFVFSAGQNLTGSWGVSITATNTVEVWINGFTSPKFTTTLVVNDLQWNHLALVKSGTTISIYVNGVADGTTYTQSGSFGTTNTITLGAYNVSVNQLLFGYISNFRYVQGSALYTSNFTPPTSPLTAVSGTQLLTCQSNKFVDNSTNAFTITRNGDVAVKSFNPFQRNSGQSYYFDGNNDYLKPNSSPVYTLGTGDFTIECWFNTSGASPVSAANAQSIIDLRTAEPSITPYLYIGGSGESYALKYFVNGTTYITGLVTAYGQWYHVAVTRSNGTTKMFVNGTQTGSSVVDSSNYVGTIPVVGGRFAATTGDYRSFYGYLTDVRITKGTARYTANNTAYLNSGSPYMNK